MNLLPFFHSNIRKYCKTKIQNERIKSLRLSARGETGFIRPDIPRPESWSKEVWKAMSERMADRHNSKRAAPWRGRWALQTVGQEAREPSQRRDPSRLEVVGAFGATPFFAL